MLTVLPTLALLIIFIIGLVLSILSSDKTSDLRENAPIFLGIVGFLLMTFSLVWFARWLAITI